MAKTYYIFRHGETFATKSGGGYGVRIFNAPILPEGKEAIEKMAKFLKAKDVDLSLSSPFKRCKQTVEIISGITGSEFKFDKRLSEFFLETFGHFKRRIKNLVDEVESSDYKSVAICTHGAVISGLTGFLTKGVFEVLSVPDYPDPGVLIIIRDHHLEEVNFNV